VDTREKIRESAGPGVRSTLVVGHFDPLVAAHAKRLRELRREGNVLIVAVTNPRAPLLSLQARSELVAGLAAVDYVVPVDGDVKEVIERIQPDEVVYEEDVDIRRTRELMEHVRTRHS